MGGVLSIVSAGGLAIFVVVLLGLAFVPKERRSGPGGAMASAVALASFAVGVISFVALIVTAPLPSADVVAERAEARVRADAACRSDFDCWLNEHRTSAYVACRRSVERAARFDFEWTDSLMGSPRFDRHGWADRERGVIRIAGGEIKMQNGFGAWQRMAYVCDFDPRTGLVADVTVAPR